MKYEVTLDDTTRVVEVRRVRGSTEVRLDDGPWQPVEVFRSGPTGRTLRRDGRATTLDVAVDGEQAFVLLDGAPFRGTVVDPRDHALDSLDGASAGTLTTQMPGAVVRVLAAVGQAVEAGEVLVVVEAMKMENEFKAPFDGTVSEVAVAAGQAVEAGATLIVVAEA